MARAVLVPSAPTLAPASSRRRHARRPRRASHATRVNAASYEKTWSNPSGTVVDVVEERKDSSVFACARPFVWNDIDVGGRMGVVKMRDGSLWIHSPIELDDATRRAVDALGPVKFVVSPNYEHVKYASQWKEAYPSATLYGCPGLKAKTAGVIPYDVDLGDVPNDVPGGVERRVPVRTLRLRDDTSHRNAVFQRSRFPSRTHGDVVHHRPRMDVPGLIRRWYRRPVRYQGVESADGQALFTGVSEPHGDEEDTIRGERRKSGA